MDLQKFVRKNILELHPYSSARDEFSGEALVYLDANENPYNKPYNRYPDPLQRELKSRIADLKGLATDSIFLGNGSDEPIDLLIRAFCEPGLHNIVQIEPTYGMYQVAAGINNVTVKKVLLSDEYQLNAQDIIDAADKNTRIIFLCSPNNPTGNVLEVKQIEKVLREFDGPVVVDEAYIDFAPGLSMLPRLTEFSNLVILQTFSKAWGMAGIRLGMAFAAPQIIDILNKIKYPYNLNILTQQKALDFLENGRAVKQWVSLLIIERGKLAVSLKNISMVEKVWPSDANFLLVRIKHARKVYEFLVENGIIVRDRSKVILCDDSLRITVGTPDENKMLVETLTKFKGE